MTTFRRWDDAEEQVEVLTAERDDLRIERDALQAEVAQLDGVIHELKAQLNARCASCLS